MNAETVPCTVSKKTVICGKRIDTGSLGRHDYGIIFKPDC